MDKRCKGCIYQGFRENDQFKTYGFCLNKNVEVAEYKINLKNGYAQKQLEKIPKGSVPACLLVQTNYDGECPYFNKGE